MRERLTIKKELSEYEKKYLELWEKIEEIKLELQHNEVERNECCYGVKYADFKPGYFECDEIKCPFAKVVPSKFTCLYYYTRFQLALLQYNLEKYFEDRQCWREE